MNMSEALYMGFSEMSAAEIVAEDTLWKEAISPGFAEDAARLFAIYEGQGRKYYAEHQRKVQLGDKNNPRSTAPNLCRRLVNQISVCYRSPPTRMLFDSDETLLQDDDPRVRALSSRRRGVYKLMGLDTAMQRADELRSLLRQSVIVYCENQERKRVTARVHTPQCLFRAPNPNSADSIDCDYAFAILLRDGSKPETQVYEVWNKIGESQWRVTIQCGTGDPARGYVQPYAEYGGVVPFAELPVQILYDEDPVGHAWLPQDQSRLDTLLNTGVMLSDMQYLVALECFTIKAAFGVDPYKPPTEVGPNKILNFPKGSDFKILSHNPQLEKASAVLQECLSMLALSEGLAPNAFARERQELTGAALRAADRILEYRRTKQVGLAVDFEAEAYRKIAAIHNEYAAEWGRPRLDETLDLLAVFPEPSIPSDAQQSQDVRFKDLQAGLMSPYEYLQAQRGISRDDAISIAEQIKADREDFGFSETLQAPGALAGGANAALGPGSASPVEGATNLDVQSNTAQASSVGAVVSSMVTPKA